MESGGSFGMLVLVLFNKSQTKRVTNRPTDHKQTQIKLQEARAQLIAQLSGHCVKWRQERQRQQIFHGGGNLSTRGPYFVSTAAMARVTM